MFLSIGYNVKFDDDFKNNTICLDAVIKTYLFLNKSCIGWLI